MPLNNFGVVVPGLWRSAQPDEEGFATLADIGITSVVKLNTESPAEQNWCNKLGIKLTQFPIPTEMNSFETIRTIVTAVHDEMQRGIVLVHCQLGRDRTGLIIGGWRIVYQGWSVDEVDAERALYGVEGAIKVMDLPMKAILAEFAKETNA